MRNPSLSIHKKEKSKESWSRVQDLAKSSGVHPTNLSNNNISVTAMGVRADKQFGFSIGEPQPSI